VWQDCKDVASTFNHVVDVSGASAVADGKFPEKDRTALPWKVPRRVLLTFQGAPSATQLMGMAG
jgi:hypothetical protein